MISDAHEHLRLRENHSCATGLLMRVHSVFEDLLYRSPLDGPLIRRPHFRRLSDVFTGVGRQSHNVVALLSYRARPYRGPPRLGARCRRGRDK
ncbi:hypothetical protein EVAR_13195_1 [Eumeta japonica]|uniref:Uncharacterized protein n=1 Tax=Eumeta variegata TaxID=151549 RepID=A0A4C1TS53_EUMVA|nr:hypothetical protein EVAR_13195_1 [Eumeta japonica]